jgi:hypothetical protein
MGEGIHALGKHSRHEVGAIHELPLHFFPGDVSADARFLPCPILFQKSMQIEKLTLQS